MASKRARKAAIYYLRDGSAEKVYQAEYFRDVIKDKRWGEEIICADKQTLIKHGKIRRNTSIYWLLIGIKKGLFDTIAVLSLDEFGASIDHAIDIIKTIHALGGRVYCHCEGIDTGTRKGRIEFEGYCKDWEGILADSAA